MAEYTNMRYDPERERRRREAVARDRAMEYMTKPPVPPRDAPNLNPPMRNLPYRPPTQTPTPGPVATPPVMRPMPNPIARPMPNPNPPLRQPIARDMRIREPFDFTRDTMPPASAPVQKIAGIQPMPRKPRQRFRGIVGRMS
jgi:hypothetical protein